jgi:glutamate/tyrosine decarboxylase-like PLP-dependent enzyme
MDVAVIPAPVDDRGRLTADSVRAAIAASDDGIFAVVATAGTTNLGVIDDLAGIADVCRERRLWFHVDGAYGAAALAVAGMRDRFAGVEQADSLIIDPHKWLFAPYDCCAVLYRDPGAARAAHSQSADYLDVINQRDEWNPADYAVQLSRRARGLPFWFSLAVHGSRAYADAIATALEVTRKAAAAFATRPYLELLMEPDLTVLVFRRRGWSAGDYHAWSQWLLAEGTAFVMPTRARGEPAARICIVNPATTVADVEYVLDMMA